MYFLAFLGLLVTASATAYSLDSEYLPPPSEIALEQMEDIPCDEPCELEELKNEGRIVIVNDRLLEELDRDEVRGHFFTVLDFSRMKSFESCLLIEIYRGSYLAVCGEDDLQQLEQRIGYFRYLLQQRDLGSFIPHDQREYDISCTMDSARSSYDGLGSGGIGSGCGGSAGSLSDGPLSGGMWPSDQGGYTPEESTDPRDQNGYTGGQCIGHCIF